MNKELEEALENLGLIDDWNDVPILYREDYKIIKQALEECENREYYLLDRIGDTITMPRKQFNDIEKELIYKTQKLDKIEEVVKRTYIYGNKDNAITGGTAILNIIEILWSEEE